MEERGLPGAVRPDDGAELARPHREAQVGHGVQRAERAPEAAHFQERRHARATSRRAVPTRPPGRKITIRTKMAPVKIIQCSV